VDNSSQALSPELYSITKRLLIKPGADSSLLPAWVKQPLGWSSFLGWLALGRPPIKKKSASPRHFDDNEEMENIYDRTKKSNLNTQN
jgi:hypothetical protein